MYSFLCVVLLTVSASPEVAWSGSARTGGGPTAVLAGGSTDDGFSAALAEEDLDGDAGFDAGFAFASGLAAGFGVCSAEATSFCFTKPSTR